MTLIFVPFLKKGPNPTALRVMPNSRVKRMKVAQDLQEPEQNI